MFKFFLIFCFLTSFIHAQEMERSPATVNELKMTHYDKDSTANAVVLLEQHFITSNPSKMKRFTKKYYIKFKILNKAALNLATIKTPFSKYVELKNLQGFTYNLNTDGTIRRTPLSEGDKFSQSYNNGLKINTVTFPEVKVGSIIEYSYTIKTNYYSVHNCYFQSNIPKKKVIYKSQTIEQFYFSMFIGYIKPKVHYQKKEPKCMGKRTCEIIYYEFEDVPAFVEEDFTDNKNNYISRIFFEKIYYDIYANKNQKKYGWGLIDDYYRKRFDKKLKKVSFFKKVIPKTIKQEKDTLKKVTEIYNFIRDHYTLNTSYNNSLTKSFKERIGNYSDINLALYNSLKALNLKPSIAVLSTRNHGFLTKLYPTYQSINYAITHVKINGKDYFLDATDKNIPLGLVPFNCLNDDVRVLDFENGTYWNAIASIIGEKIPNRSPSIPVALVIKSLNLSCADCAFKLLYATFPYSSLNLLAPNTASSC